jgi:F0F1-type ATP synthase membrane subunit b/b'
VADRLRAVIGEEVAAMQTKVRAQVDAYVEEQAAPVRARIAELRAESDRRVADARTRLDEEKRRLEERIRTLGGNLPIPGIGG